MNDTQHLARLTAALDGELDAAGQAEAERAIAAHPAMAAAGARLAAVRDAVGKAAQVERAPPRLVAAVAAMAPAPERARWRDMPRALAASLLIVGFLGGAGTMLLGRSGGPPSTDEALAAGYLRAALGGGGIDIASSDRHVVKPWLAARAPLGTAAVDLADQGFKLLGGRVDIVAYQPAPTLVYAVREHVVALTQLPADGGGAAVRIASLRGLNFAAWSDGARAYRAVSDISQPDLLAFVKAFQAAAAKEAE